MTIKQQGGIFGRNPTFNDVDANKISIQNSTQPALEVDNTGSDGDIIDVQKNGSSVGSIGNFSTRMYLESTGDASGILFGSTNLTPRKNATFASDAVSLGDPTYKFKYLYLSRNVVVGNGYGIDFSATSGTGTSELFDDYEEGTFTPTLNLYGGTPTTSGVYTKIGRQVFVYASVTLDGTSDSSQVGIRNFPFATNSSNFGGAFITSYDGGVADIILGAFSGYNGVAATTSDDLAVTYNTLGVSSTIRIAAHYFVD